MNKMIGGLGVTLAILTMTFSTGHSVPAQASAATAEDAPGLVEIKEGKDGKFRFNIRNGDGKLLAMSGPSGYKTVEDVEEILEQLKDVIKTAKVVGGSKKD